jgi:hypothetical protein
MMVTSKRDANNRLRASITNNRTLRGKVAESQCRRRREPAALVAIAQSGADEPAHPETQRHRHYLKDHIAGEQNIEESFDMEPNLHHALRSGINWLSSLAI